MPAPAEGSVNPSIAAAKRPVAIGEARPERNRRNGQVNKVTGGFFRVNSSRRLFPSGCAWFAIQCAPARVGGADRDRTDDLLIANETLFQLSYSPIPAIAERPRCGFSPRSKILFRRENGPPCEGSRGSPRHPDGLPLNPARNDISHRHGFWSDGKMLLPVPWRQGYGPHRASRKRPCFHDACPTRFEHRKLKTPHEESDDLGRLRPGLKDQSGARQARLRDRSEDCATEARTDRGRIHQGSRNLGDGQDRRRLR